MKTFGDIKKGDKLYVVNEGTAIPGGVEILVHEVFTDYGEIFGPDGKSLDPLKGVTVDNPFGGELPLCLNAEETHSGMYFTSLEEAMQEATKAANKMLKEYEKDIMKKTNEVFNIHEQMVILNLKKQSWEKN